MHYHGYPSTRDVPERQSRIFTKKVCEGIQTGTVSCCDWVRSAAVIGCSRVWLLILNRDLWLCLFYPDVSSCCGWILVHGTGSGDNSLLLQPFCHCRPQVLKYIPTPHSLWRYYGREKHSVLKCMTNGMEILKFACGFSLQVGGLKAIMKSAVLKWMINKVEMLS